MWWNKLWANSRQNWFFWSNTGPCTLASLMTTPNSRLIGIRKALICSNSKNYCSVAAEKNFVALKVLQQKLMMLMLQVASDKSEPVDRLTSWWNVIPCIKWEHPASFSKAQFAALSDCPKISAKSATCFRCFRSTKFRALLTTIYIDWATEHTIGYHITKLMMFCYALRFHVLICRQT